MHDASPGVMARTLSIAVAVVKRCKPPPRDGRPDDTWDKAVNAATHALAVASSPEHDGVEGIAPVLLKVVEHAIGSITCLLSLLDNQRHHAAPGSSVLLARVGELVACFPCYPIDEHRACLLEHASTCKAAVDRARQALDGSSRSVRAGVDRLHARHTGGLFTYASENRLISAARKQQQDAFDSAQNNLLIATRAVEDPGASHAVSYLDRLATIACKDPSLLPVRDIVATTGLVLDLVAAMVGERGRIEDGDEIEVLLPEGIASRFPRRVPELPEREESGRLARAIAEIDSAIAALDAMHDDPGLDVDEKRAGNVRRAVLERQAFEARHHKIRLDERFRWREPEARQNEDARWVIKVLGAMKNDLLRFRT